MPHDNKDNKVPPSGPSDNEKLFHFPDDYAPASLVDDLASWLKSEREWEAEVLTIQDGWVIQARNAGSVFKKLVTRRAESWHVIITSGKEGLKVVLGLEDWSESKEKKQDKSFSIKNLPSMAWDAAADITDAASNLWVETETADSVFDYIARHIAASRQTKVTVDASTSRYVEEITIVESAWLTSFLEPDEILLAWLHTSTQAPDADKDEWRFLLTTHRQALTAFSKDRFLSYLELPNQPMFVTDSLGRDTAAIGETSWRTQYSNDKLFQEIAPLTELAPRERLYEAVRLNFISGDKKQENLDYIQALLDYLSTLTDEPRHLLSRVYVSTILGKEKEDILHFDLETIEKNLNVDRESIVIIKNLPSEKLDDWAASWALSSWEKISLAAFIQSIEPDSPELALIVENFLADSRKNLLKKEKNKILHILSDIYYAQNLGLLGRNEEGAEILEKSLSKLPDETLSDLLPTGGMDLTKGEGGQLMKVKILELLAELRGTPEQGDLDTLRELAVLQPLVLTRLEKLGQEGGMQMRRLVSTPLEILQKGRSSSYKDAIQDVSFGSISKLRDKDLDDKLRHPAGREGSIFRSMQSFIAVKNVPDHSDLKSYAKRITLETEPSIATAIIDGECMLGLKDVEGYISFGELNTGVRGYDGRPPFLLIGSEHLTAESAYFMEPLELKFIIGKELAHIKFKHERITSREVWEGAFEKAFSIVELVPVLGGYIGKLGHLSKLAGKASTISKTIGDFHGYIKQARDISGTAQDFFMDKKDSKTVAKHKSEEQDLIGAFRVMQLTADRAGLLLCNDLTATVRAIFKSSPNLIPELPLMEQNGLDQFLSRTDDQGELIFQQLAIRLAALFSFYLSEDFEALQFAAYPD